MNSDTHNGNVSSSSEKSLEDHNPERELQNGQDVPTLPVVESSFVEDDIPEDITGAIVQQLDEGEAIFVLFRLNSGYSFTLASGKSEKVPLWTVMTGTRLLLLAISSEGELYFDTYNQHTIIEYQNGFSRDTIKIANKSLFTGLWEGKRWLFKEAAKLFPLPEYEKYLYIAGIYLEKEQDLQAIPLLRKSIALVPTIKSYLSLVRIFSQHNRRDDAIQAIKDALKFTEAASLVEETQLLFPGKIEIQLYLAAAFEDNHIWDECITIYQALLQKNPDFDLYFLKLGEMHNARQDYETAISYYQKFIAMRTESEKFAQGEFLYWNMSNLKWFSADPDLVKAYFDLGLLYEYELNDHERAVPIYLSLLRHAPFYPDTYKHFWIVCQQLQNVDEPHGQVPSIVLNTFLQVYKLLFPAHYASVVANMDGSQSYTHIGSSPGNGLAKLPVGYYQIQDSDHDCLVHQGEKKYLQLIQNWLTNLVITEDDGQGIEEYCEQVGLSNFPRLSQTISRIADFLNLKPPKCFISRGKIGISVRNKETPFIFIGSEHLNQENERYFSQPELVFIIAAQTEHIKSGHLLITGTDLWKSLGTASFDGFLVALQCLPTGSFLGKLTRRVATEGLKQVYKMTQYSSLQKFLDFFDKGKAEKGGEEVSDGFEDAPKGEKSAGKPEPDSVLKEQIVGFARHAVYTADRVGLLACNNIEAACSVIFKLAGNAYSEIENIHTNGLFQVLESQDNRGNYLYFEYTKRFSELIRFALSEDYNRMHSRLVSLPEEHPEETSPPPKRETDDYHLLMNKLQILEQSVQNDLLSPEEFARKEKNLIRSSSLLTTEEDMLLFDKLQQAFLDEILTLDEFHTKIFTLLETKHETKSEDAEQGGES